MQVLQNTLLRTIGIKRDLAKSKYGILDVSEFVSKTSLEQVICILTTDGKEPSDHRLSASIRSSTRSHFPFTIPLCNPKFDRNAVIRALVHLRDKVYGTGRAFSSQRPTQPPPAPPAPAVANGVFCTNPSCLQPDRTWTRLDRHLPSCLRDNPPAPST